MEPTRMVLEIDRASDHLGGWLIDGSGGRHRFDGWLEFASAFTAATSDDEGSGPVAVTEPGT